MHEVTIRGGLVVDGSGGEPYRADVGIDGGRITAIAEGLEGHEVLDAGGCVVAPGFIDLHTHYDPQVLWDPALSPSSQLGVTSVVAGNCGFSIAPCPPALRESMIATLVNVEDMRSATLHAGIDWSFETYGEYLQSISDRGTAINFGGYVGHTAVRLTVMGDDAYEREATADEIERMAASSRNRSPPGRWVSPATARRFTAATAAGRCLQPSRRWTRSTRCGRPPTPPGPGSSTSRPARTTTGSTRCSAASRPRSPGRPFSRIHPAPPRKPRGRRSFRTIAPGSAAGSDVHPQVTCRPVTFQLSMADPSTLYMVPAFSRLSALRPRRAHRGLPGSAPGAAWRRRSWTPGKHVDMRWDACVVSETDDPAVAERVVADIARERGVHPLDCLLDIALADGLTSRFTINFANDDADAVSQLLQEPGCVLGLSDAGAHIGQICDAVHAPRLPRALGTRPRADAAGSRNPPAHR